MAPPERQRLGLFQEQGEDHRRGSYCTGQSEYGAGAVRAVIPTGAAARVRPVAETGPGWRRHRVGKGTAAPPFCSRATAPDGSGEQQRARAWHNGFAVALPRRRPAAGPQHPTKVAGNSTKRRHLCAPCREFFTAAAAARARRRPLPFFTAAARVC